MEKGVLINRPVNPPPTLPKKARACQGQPATPTVAPPTLTPINNKASICVKTFNDANQNRWYDANEQPLAGIKITLADRSGKDQDIATEAPTCFNDLANGTFIIAAVPPKDYALTTPHQLQVQAT